MQRAIVGITTAIFAAVVTSEAAVGQVSLRAYIDCGLWSKHRKADTALLYENYLLGFMDGITLGRYAPFWKSDETPSRESVYLWMDNYCRENPLSNIETGGAVLHEEVSGWASPR